MRPGLLRALLRMRDELLPVQLLHPVPAVLLQDPGYLRGSVRWLLQQGLRKQLLRAGLRLRTGLRLRPGLLRTRLRLRPGLRAELWLRPGL